MRGSGGGVCVGGRYFLGILLCIAQKYHIAIHENTTPRRSLRYCKLKSAPLYRAPRTFLVRTSRISSRVGQRRRLIFRCMSQKGGASLTSRTILLVDEPNSSIPSLEPPQGNANRGTVGGQFAHRPTLLLAFSELSEKARAVTLYIYLVCGIA